MGLGQWKMVSGEILIEERGELEYLIMVDALPVINGVPALRQPALDSIKSKDTYASNYYLSEAKFFFNAESELVELRMYSPMDVVEVWPAGHRADGRAPRNGL